MDNQILEEINTGSNEADIKPKEYENPEEKSPVLSPNVLTGGQKNWLIYKLRESFKKAEKIDIIVSFLMESGVKLIREDIKKAADRGVKIRILTGNYLKITQPQALYMLKGEFGDKIDLRFYNVKNKSFHPKSYIFHSRAGDELYVGSSNLSRGALKDSIEWNYRLVRENNERDFDAFYAEFEDLFNNHSQIINDEVMESYARTWVRPKLYKDIEKNEDLPENPETGVIELYEPKGAQIEALYGLKTSRNEGYDKAIVVAATGIGKTYLAAFDSVHAERVLFVAHREEILFQAARSFKNVRKTDDIGFFYGKHKDTDKSVIFALVETLGKKEYLNPGFFAEDYFDYIIVDEFHHAVSNNYRNIIDYFDCSFLLGLTATPERLDSKDVFAICDYNVAYEIRLQEAINRGFLVPFRYYGIYDSTVDYDDIEFKNGKYDEKNLEDALMINKRADLVLKNYLKYNSSRAIGFCSSKKHAQYMAEYFKNNNIKAEALYSGADSENHIDRKEAVNGLLKAEINVLFVVDMFNEGVDIPSLDLVMFLRPTQSPTVFLQQLGRGLRKFKNKEYLTVLDFIGNYKKADMIPFLLSGRPYASDGNTGERKITPDMYPEDCLIDFDFQLVDIFERTRKAELKIQDIIKEEYGRIKELVNHRPTRYEFYTNLEHDIWENIKKKPKLNPLNNYFQFLYENEELTAEEKELYNSRGGDFINMIELTGMSKSYKMPVFLGFFNDGNVRMKLTEDEAYKSFYKFYKDKTHRLDMMKEKSKADFDNWTKKDYLKLIKQNPVNALLKTEKNFFVKDEDCIIALTSDLKNFISNESFIENMKDAVDYRVTRYYEERIKQD